MWLALSTLQAKALRKLLRKSTKGLRAQQTKTEPLDLVLERLESKLNPRTAGRKLEERFMRYASEKYYSEGDLEFDEDDSVSMANGKDGAYVMCWKWIDREDLDSDS